MFVGESSDDGVLEGFTAPDAEEMRKVIEIYKDHGEENETGDEGDILSDIYCDFFDAWACNENLYFASGHFYWKPFKDEEIVLKEGVC